MTESLAQSVDVLGSIAPLLSAESADEFASLRKELKNEIDPEGVIAQMYVDDFAAFIWEILRLRRYSTAIIINNSRLATLQRILERLLCHRNCDRPCDKISTPKISPAAGLTTKMLERELPSCTADGSVSYRVGFRIGAASGRELWP